MKTVTGLLFALGLHAQILTPVAFSPSVNGSAVANPTTTNSGGSCSGSDGGGWSCSSTTTVSVVDGTSGATICYRTDGTNPAATTPGTCDGGSTTYSSGISTAATTTYKMLGTKSGLTNSSVVTVVYTIGYVGPLDVSGFGTNVFAWWGLRCSATAYTGNVADIWDGATGSTTETKLTCSSGGTINETINALSTTCAVSCVVATLYDQSGNTACTTACDLTQSTNANRPVLTLNCLSTKYCMTWSGTKGMLAPATFANHAQPFTYSAVIQRTGNFTSRGSILSDANTNEASFLFREAANTLMAFAGTTQTLGSVADSTWHAVQILWSGASSNLYVDGSANTISPGTASIVLSHQFTIGAGPSNLTATSFEYGVWTTDKSANFSAMNSNQKSYWGF